ncbi:MAG: hypothetical protein CV087_21215 [Candidatus Brocadia sp. WS118]|nr:MAG: hypothetical protein CV087_21215 [Candidatus Brocadia sp. WS118]
MKQIYETYREHEKLSTLLRELLWSHNVLIVHYKVDLLFYHRLLRCLVPVKLKIGRFKPGYERRNNNQIKQC